jgi:hypothetical protein
MDFQEVFSLRETSLPRQSLKTNHGRRPQSSKSKEV